MIKLEEKDLIQTGQYGNVEFVKFAYGENEITFETSDGLHINAVHYDVKKDKDVFIALEDFADETIRLVRRLLVNDEQ